MVLVGCFFKQVFLEVMNSVLMTGEIPGLFAKDEMMAMTADLRNSFLKVTTGDSFYPSVPSSSVKTLLIP